MSRVGPPPEGMHDVAPTELHKRAAELYGWTVVGWGSWENIDRSGALSKTLLERKEGPDGLPQTDSDFLHVPTTASVDDWIKRMLEARRGRPTTTRNIHLKPSRIKAGPRKLDEML